MAVYLTSDLHGFSVFKFRQLLNIIGFSNDDWLFILGDVVDKNNDGGIELLKWIMTKPNIELIRGNHEQMLIDSLWIFDTISRKNLDNLTNDKLEVFYNWISNGGYLTLLSLEILEKNDRPLFLDVVDYLKQTPLYEVVDVANKRFVLCHSGFANFNKNKKLCEYTKEELLWNRPSTSDYYFEKTTVVFGHTPTSSFGSPARAFHKNNWIDIDMGVSQNQPPMFLRLDDLHEFYFD